MYKHIKPEKKYKSNSKMYKKQKNSPPTLHEQAGRFIIQFFLLSLIS